MTLPSKWEILVISLWTQVGFLSWIHCKDGTVVHLSQEDLLALKDEQNPKCFSRTQWDGICFFETADNRTYDLFYNVDDFSRLRWTMCEMSQTEEGTFLHICSFPPFFFAETNLKVVEHNTNATLYNRTVYMDELILLNPPFNVSLHQTGKAGQLKVSWQSSISKYQKDDVIYKIRYSSKTLGEKTKEAKEGDILDSLVAGEVVEVQVSVKSAASSTRLWSGWSHPVRAVVPQSADISTMCYTSDLQNITCQWNGSRYGEENEYKLYYKTSLSEVSGWTDWTECLADRSLTDLCSFRGDESKKFRVKLSNAPAPLSRTFYSEEFTLRNSIKTSPPSHLTGAFENGKLCLKWEAPLPSLSAHLRYEVSYRIRGAVGEMFACLIDHQTGKCLLVPAGIKYSVKIRATPMGFIYSGNWSDWSDEFIGDTPADENTLLLLLLLIPPLMLITAIILIYQFNTPLRKFKLYIWPPVPNLDKVLQGYLTEINGQNWNPPLITKQCSEETIPSLVEIMSDDEVSESGKPSEESTQLLSPEGSFLCREQVDGSPGTEVFPDYVTLNKDSVVLCPKGNKYVVEYETSVCEKEAPAVKNELFQTCNSSCADGSVCTKPCCTDFLNHSYLLLAEPADGVHCKVIATRVPGNLYTNLPCS